MQEPALTIKLTLDCNGLMPSLTQHIKSASIPDRTCQTTMLHSLEDGPPGVGCCLGDLIRQHDGLKLNIHILGAANAPEHVPPLVEVATLHQAVWGLGQKQAACTHETTV